MKHRSILSAVYLKVQEKLQKENMIIQKLQKLNPECMPHVHWLYLIFQIRGKNFKDPLVKI